MKNPLRLRGIEYLEYATARPEPIERLFTQLGMTKTRVHQKKSIQLFEQNDIRFLLSSERESFAGKFSAAHGPSISAMGLRVEDAGYALAEAVKRGARPYKGGSTGLSVQEYPAIYGIGDSLIYFIDTYGSETIYDQSFRMIAEDKPRANKLLRVDHLTNNVPAGEMQKWCDFYSEIFGFVEVRYFDIRGARTGLFSKVMCLEDHSIMIPINEPSDDKSQIQEYLDEYHGSGIQHIALSTADIIDSVGGLRSLGMEFLETPDTYYEMVKKRVPDLEENLDALKKLRVLADGDAEGYLLQIFTKNVIGPIFYEIIQRKNHWGFGEGNFQALFDAIERDQISRGYLK